MTTIKNYDSRNSISTYDLGDVCTFYLQNVEAGRFGKMNEKDAAKYSKALNKAIKENARLVGGSGKYHKLIRAVGIVVGKHNAAQGKGPDMITVMFKANDGYILNKYAVGTSNVLTNGQNYVRPTAKLDISVI